MASTAARLLRLLSLLQGGRSWPGAALAERLEVHPRSLRRDIERLRALGYPVHAARDPAAVTGWGRARPPCRCCSKKKQR